jgi:hypothetical protein
MRGDSSLHPGVLGCILVRTRDLPYKLGDSILILIFSLSNDSSQGKEGTIRNNERNGGRDGDNLRAR